MIDATVRDLRDSFRGQLRSYLGRRVRNPADVEELVDRLDPKYRDAISLVEIGGLGQAEAAARLGISLSGMKSRVQRGRGKLKTLLLECCHVELDRRGGVVDSVPRAPCDCVGSDAGRPRSSGKSC